MVEIYGLFHPETDELRYIGKANNADERLKTHLLDSKKFVRPIHRWVSKLLRSGKRPVVRVLETVPTELWEETERRLIAEYRTKTRLLNLADGGNQPSQTPEQARRAAQASNAAQKKRPEEVRALRTANIEMAKLHGRFVKDGSHRLAYRLKFMMRCYAELGNSPASWSVL